MADPHSPHLCEVCNSEYEPTRNKDGTPYKTKHQTCSRSCYNKLRDHRRSVEAFCPSCLSFYRRVPRRRDYDGKFCSHACYAKHYRRVKAEVDALHSIGRARRKAIARTWRANVLPEIQALRRIAAHRHDAIIQYVECQACGQDMRVNVRKPGRRPAACAQCRSLADREVRRAAKAKRRASCRGSLADTISPAAVFARDKWRCHLCGRKTKLALRGTAQPLAPELDHIVSLADGGTHTWGNVACSCRECNNAKGARSKGQIGMSLPA